MGVVSQQILPYGRQWLEEDDVEAVAQQLRTDWLTQGPRVAEFESALCRLTGARFCVAVSTGTAALHLACLAAGVRSGDIGITSTITFVASANAILYAGGAPRLADVEPATGLISLDSLDALVDALDRQGSPPRVLIPVDFAGTPVNLPRIQAIAQRVGAKVIEDAAHSLGATYTEGGRSFSAASCAHSDLAILSFHPVKHITTGEGGAVTTNDEAMYQALLELRSHGITKDPSLLTRNDGPWYYEQHSLGHNFRLTDFQCALGLSQLTKLPRFVERRRVLARKYDDAFARSEHVEPLEVREGANSSYHLYVLRLRARGTETLDSIAARRLKLFHALREAGIAAQIHYIPVHRQPFHVQHGHAEGSFPGADRYYAGCLSVPLFPRMSDDDVERVVKVVRSTLGDRP